MRIYALILLGAFCFLSVGCDVILQPSQQGEWSDATYKNPKYQVTKEPEKPTERAPK